MSALPKEKEERHFTYADYKDWELDEGERFELINGEAYAMAAPNVKHQEILTEIFGRIFIYLQGKTCKVLPAPLDVRLFYEEDESDDTVVQPDIVVICDRTKLGPEGCRGAPDLVVEVLSPSNTAIEMGRKLELYREAGIREYWVIDPENKTLTVYYFQADSSITKTYKSTDTVSVDVLPGLDIPLEQVFAE